MLNGDISADKLTGKQKAPRKRVPSSSHVSSLWQRLRIKLVEVMHFAAYGYKLVIENVKVVIV